MSSKEFFFSSGNAYCALAVTPASFGPCSTFALANAGSERASALPAPSLRNSRRRTYNHFGVTSDERMRDLRDDPTPPARARLRFCGFRLADDGRDRRRQRLGLLGRGLRRGALLPRVPALAGRALFLRAQLRAVLIADEPDPRAARAVQASFDAAAHVQRTPGARRLRRKANRSEEHTSELQSRGQHSFPTRRSSDLLGRGLRRGALLPRVPALAGRALFLRAQLRAVLIADEPDPRAARAVQASFDAAAHVQRTPGARRLRRKANDPLRGNRRGKLAFRREPPIALQDALLLRRGELARVVLAEPAVARAGARLSAAGDRAQPPRAPAVEMAALAGSHLAPGTRRGHLLFHLARDDGGQLAREPVDDRTKRRIPCLICHAIVPYSQISAAKAAQPHSFLSRGAAQCERKQQLPAEQALQPVLSLFFQLLAFRLRFRLRALLRVGLHLPCLLLRGLLRLRRIDAEGAPEQRRAPFFHDLVHGGLQVEIRRRRVPGRPDQLEIDGDRIRRLHLPAGEGGDRGRGERHGAGQIERAVYAHSARERHLRLRERDLDRVLQPR